jgi:phosphoserine aminotransferase
MTSLQIDHKHPYNFGAGPAKIPKVVLQKASEDLMNFRGTGLGIGELSHRSDEFLELLEEIRSNLRELMNIPKEYHILFCTGGATNQFSMIPMNFLGEKRTADFIINGIWSKKALEEAKKFGNAQCIASSADNGFRTIPKDFNFSEAPSYVYFNSNETIYGNQFQSEPISPFPLICDASSDILSREIDVSKYAMIFAGAQKNLGIAGVTLIIMHEQFFNSIRKEDIPFSLPTLQSYETYVKDNSLYNTPPVFCIYFLGEILHWIKTKGGVRSLESANREKADLIYKILDASSLYKPYVDKNARSMVNITFTLSSETLEKELLTAASQNGFLGIQGHRTVGGFRISLYNSITREETEALADFLKDFSNGR